PSLGADGLAQGIDIPRREQRATLSTQRRNLRHVQARREVITLRIQHAATQLTPLLDARIGGGSSSHIFGVKALRFSGLSTPIISRCSRCLTFTWPSGRSVIHDSSCSGLLKRTPSLQREFRMTRNGLTSSTASPTYARIPRDTLICAPL